MRCLRTHSADSGAGDEEGVEADSGDGAPDAQTTATKDDDAAIANQADAAEGAQQTECTLPSPACAAGALQACTTSCGTQGTGRCSPTCRAPTATECMGPTETCNLRDDDCDGVVDPNFVERWNKGFHVWTAASDEFFPNMKLLPRGPDGLQMFWRTDGTSDVMRQELDKRGSIASNKQRFQDTAKFFTWTAGSDGQRLAFAGATSSTPTKDSELFLRLYAASGSFIAEVNDFKLKCLIFAYPRELVLSPGAGGATHIALTAHLQTGAEKSDGTCDMAKTTKHVATFFRTASSDGVLTAPVQVDFGALIQDPRIVRVPCADEWLIAEVNRNTQMFRRFSFDGRAIAANDDLMRGGDLWDLEAVPDSACTGGTSMIYALASSPDTDKSFATQLVKLRLDRNTGAITKAEPAPDISSTQLSEAQLLSQGGRLFLSGLDHRAILALVEISGDAKLRTIPLTPIDLSALPGDGIDPRGFNLTEFSLTTLAWAGEALVVGTGMTGQFVGAADARDPGDTDQPVAVTYNVGCP